MPLTHAQEMMLIDGRGYVELRGSAAFRVARRLEALGFGTVSTSQSWETNRFVVKTPAELVERWDSYGESFAAKQQEKVDAARLSKNLSPIVWPADKKVSDEELSEWVWQNFDEN